MVSLPIVERELRVLSRKTAFYYSRLKMPAISIVILLVFLFTLPKGMPMQYMAKTLFNFCFYSLFATCLMAGVQITADTISSEKREGTLGLLFLTDLKGYDIILGKLVSASVLGIYGAMALLPVISIIFLIGGIDWAQFLKLVITYGNILFFSLNAGLLASVLSKEERRARSLAMGLIVGLTVLSPLIGLLQYQFNKGWGQTPSLSWFGAYAVFSPIGAFTSSINPSLASGWRDVLISGATVQAAGWIMFALSCWLVKWTWQDKAQKSERKVSWIKRLTLGADNTERRKRMLDILATHWLTFRRPSMAYGPWLVLASVGVIFAVLMYGFFVPSFPFPMVIIFVLMSNTLLKKSMIQSAGRWLIEDRQSGSLELALTTRMTVEDMLNGQWKSLHKIYRGPFIVCALMQISVLSYCFVRSTSMQGSFSESIILLLFSLIVMVLDYFAIGWVAMWHALSVTPINQAPLKTFRTVVMAPWVVFYVIMLIFGVLMRRGIGNLAMMLWLGVMVGMPIYHMLRAKGRLMAEFRVRAMERYVPVSSHPIWAKMGRFVAQTFYSRK